MFAAPAVMRYWNSPPPKDLAEAREWAAYLEGMQHRIGYAQWRVGERAGDRPVGIAGLQPLDGGPEVELTYALEPCAWGSGYATEASAAALEYGFGEAGLERVVAIADEENRGSLAVLRRLGLRPLGAARYWGKSWAKFALPASAWREERAAATPPLRTERLELRRLAAADGEPLAEVFGDPAVMRFVGADRRPLDAPHLVASLAIAGQHWERHGYGPLAVVERASGRLVGEAGLQPLDGGPDVELTYTLARAAWGRGYATEAARAVLRWAFAGLLLPRVEAVADPGNDAALRVLERLGMAPLGPRECYASVLAEWGLTFGAWRDLAGPAPARG